MNGVDVISKGYNGRHALTLAAECGEVQCLNYLADYFQRQHIDIDTPDFDGQTALVYAVKGGNDRCVRTLLSKGASTTARDLLERTAVFHAAELGHAACIDALISDPRGKDALDMTFMGQTPIMIATTEQHVECVRLLLVAEASVEHRYGYHGQNLLHEAARNGNLQIVRMFVKAGMNINERDSFQRTPLMNAADLDRGDAVRQLMELGADASLTDLNGNTAADLARKEGYAEILRILESREDEVKPKPQ